MKTKLLFIAAIVIGLAATRASAESYTTNIVDGVTNNAGGDYYVGHDGSFNVLIVTNAGILIDSNAYMGALNGDNNSATVTGSLNILE